MWATITISGDNLQREGKMEGGLGTFMFVCWFVALVMVIVCTVKEWR